MTKNTHAKGNDSSQKVINKLIIIFITELVVSTFFMMSFLQGKDSSVFCADFWYGFKVFYTNIAIVGIGAFVTALMIKQRFFYRVVFTLGMVLVTLLFIMHISSYIDTHYTSTIKMAPCSL